MNKKLLLPFALLLTLLSACQTESISGSYRPELGRELTEYDVLGIELGEDISDEQIGTVLDNAGRLEMPRQGRVLLVQSGAVMPDGELLDAMGKLFQPVPMSGYAARSSSQMNTNTTTGQQSPRDLSKTLRLAAAQAGAQTVIVVWGVLESIDEMHGSTAVSWVPIVGSFIPDETKHMRIRLKAVVMDVRTGAWEMVVPETFMSKTKSSSLKRQEAKDKMILELKQEAYAKLAEMINLRFVR